MHEWTLYTVEWNPAVVDSLPLLLSHRVKTKTSHVADILQCHSRPFSECAP